MIKRDDNVAPRVLDETRGNCLAAASRNNIVGVVNLSICFGVLQPNAKNPLMCL